MIFHKRILELLRNDIFLIKILYTLTPKDKFIEFLSEYIVIDRKLIIVK